MLRKTFLFRIFESSELLNYLVYFRVKNFVYFRVKNIIVTICKTFANDSSSNYYVIEDNVTILLNGRIHSSYYHRRITIGSSMHPRADIGTRYAGTNESLGTLGVTSSQPIYLAVIRCQTL